MGFDNYKYFFVAGLSDWRLYKTLDTAAAASDRDELTHPTAPASDRARTASRRTPEQLHRATEHAGAPGDPQPQRAAR